MPLSRDLMKQDRIVMHPSRHGVRGVSMLGRYNYTRARPGLPEHMHRQAMEICYLVKGRQSYRVGGETCRLRGGDVFVTLPNERHSTGGAPEEKGVLYWMVLSLPCRGNEFLDLPAGQGKALLRALCGLQRRHFRGTRSMQKHLDAILKMLHDKSDPLRLLAVSNQVVAFLLEVVVAAKSAGETSGQPMDTIIRYIEQHAGEPLTVAHLAEQAGLSAARFKARFKEETGLPPWEYVLRTRIEEAQRRLREGKSTVTEIAYDLGFSSSQYFATVFRRFTGAAPSSLRKD